MKYKSVRNSVMGTASRNRIMVLLLAAVTAAASAANLVPPLILKKLIDYNFNLKRPDGLLYMGFMYILVIVLTGVLNFLKEALLTILGQKITKDVRLDMMEKLEKVRASYFSANETGQIVSRLTNDVDAVSSMFTSGIAGMTADIFKIAGVIFSMFYFSSSLGVISLIILPLIYAATRFFQKRMLSSQVENRKQIGEVNSHISESFRNVLMIKSFSKEHYMEKKYASVLEKNYQTLEKVNFYDSIFSPVIRMMRAVVIAIIAMLSAGETGFFGISLGTAAASIDLIASLFTPVENLGMELQSIQKSISGVKRINEFFAEEEDLKEELEKELTLNNIHIHFDNVSFAYEKGSEVLKNISMEINHGEKVTFVGRTGVGKSTLFKLIAGLLKPVEGKITINGTDVFTIPNHNKRKIFGYVEQNFHMVKGTVADQVSLGDRDITMAQVKNAVEMVGLGDYVENLENGYDTVVSGEGMFSQGQKQLLSIARAIVANPPILLLDEITANLDSVTEDKVVSVLEKAGGNRTVLTISHRLSSMVSADKVAILERGKLKNYGKPEELLKSDEWYRSRIKLEKLIWSK
ncbi:MAG: ABC transporter ATP-binding protein [Sedimentibacter sp.]|uniref:ABC transporter ATP-binding protein n=1 Tax=Sedimentibacter sp. TaxID=1960295 RepID=UPI00315935D3